MFYMHIEHSKEYAGCFCHILPAGLLASVAVSSDGTPVCADAALTKP